MASGPRTAWSLCASSARPKPGEAELFDRRLQDALLVLHELRRPFDIFWNSGHDGGCALRSSARGRSDSIGIVPVLQAYPEGRWVRKGPQAATGPVRAFGWRGSADGGALRSGAERPWSDTVAAMFARALPGVEILWEATPVPTEARSNRALPALVPVPPGYRFAPASAPERRIDDLEGARRIGTPWAVTASLAGPSSAEALARVVTGASRQEGGGGIGWRPVGLWHRRPRPFVLTNAELAGLFPTPWSRWARPGEGVAIGTTRLRIGTDLAGWPVTVPVEPGNGRHLVVTGETGMGKSTLLTALAVRAAAIGTLVVFDPVGDTARAVLAGIPESAVGRVTWISPVAPSVGSNALGWAGAHGGIEGERGLEELLNALRRTRSARFEAASFWGPRIEETAGWALLAAAGTPDGTLVTAEAVLTEPIGHLSEGLEPRIRAALAALRERQRDRPEEVEGARRMLAEVNRSAVLRRMLSDPAARWTIESSLTPGRITLFTGEAGAVGEPTALTLLGVQLALLWAALPSRQARSPVFLVLDEAALYSIPVLGELLRLSRRFGTHVLLATQSFATLPEAAREAVWTNASDFVLFRGSPMEAREFERWGGEVGTERIVSLPRGQAIVLCGKGHDIRSLRLGPPGPREPARDRWARVQANLRSWGDAIAPPSSPNPRPADPAAAPPFPREVQAVVEALRALAGGSTSGSQTVDLARLRAEGRLSVGTIRRAGGWLASRRIIRARSAAEGRGWEVDRAALATLRPSAEGAPGGAGPAGTPAGDPSSRP